MSELTQLEWRSHSREVGGQVLVYGKAATRTIKLPPPSGELQALRGMHRWMLLYLVAGRRKVITEVQVNRIVKAAAMRIPGLERQVATKVLHLAAHAHASHAMDRGALFTWLRTLGHAVLLRLGATSRDRRIAVSRVVNAVYVAIGSESPK